MHADIFAAIVIKHNDKTYDGLHHLTSDYCDYLVMSRWTLCTAMGNIKLFIYMEQSQQNWQARVDIT